MESAALFLFYSLSIIAIVVVLGVWLRVSRKRRRRLGYQKQLERAVADGVLTPHEVRRLEQLRRQGALSEGEARMAALAVYRRALAAAMADARITEQEAASLRRTQQLLGLTDRDLAADAVHVRRMRILAQVECGQLPVVDPPIELAPGEIGHWTMQATLCERLALSGQETPGPTHLLFDVAVMEPFSAEGERQALGSSPNILPIDLGVLVITGRALRFRGAKSETIIDHGRLRRVALYRDGLRVDVVDPLGSRSFLVPDPELTAAVLLLAARSRVWRMAR